MKKKTFYLILATVIPLSFGVGWLVGYSFAFNQCLDMAMGVMKRLDIIIPRDRILSALSHWGFG